ncbi:hypothetical protein HaLaN_14763, partial [Haematococcus lacustris]
MDDVSGVHKWLPAWGAVLASSALFTACHLGSLAAQDLPQ